MTVAASNTYTVNDPKVNNCTIGTWPQTTWPTYTYPTYTYTVQGEDARLRLALELIADCATVEEAQRIAAKALRIADE